MSDDKLLKARSDASRAKTLMEDEILQDAFVQLKKTYSEKLFNTSIDKADDREKLYVAFRIVTQVEQHLQAILDNGKIADHELNHLIAMQAKPAWHQV